jgi:hypothetical protein
MIGGEVCVGQFNKGLIRRLLTPALLVSCLIAASAGCSLMPRPARDFAGKVGLRSKDAELKAKVEADKFPTAKEAGI